MDEKQNSCIIDLTSDSETEDDTKNTTLKSSFGDYKDTIKSQTRAEGSIKQLNVFKKLKMDEKQNSPIIDLISDSETEDDAKNTTLKSSFGHNKDTIKSQTRAEGSVKQLNVTKLSDVKKERESLRLQSGSSLQKLNLSNPGYNSLKNNKFKWLQTSNKTAENLFIHPNFTRLLGNPEEDLSFDMHISKDDVSSRKDSLILPDTYIRFYHDRKLYEEGVIKIKSYSTHRSVKSVDLDCVASHKTITPHEVPITDVVEISSDGEETVDVPKAHPLSVKQIQTQEKEVKSYKSEEDKSIPELVDEIIDDNNTCIIEAKEYKGVTIKRGTITSKPINIEMSPLIINTNVISEAGWGKIIKNAVKEFQDNKMKKEANEIEARKKKAGEIKNGESAEQGFDRLMAQIMMAQELEYNESEKKEEEENERQIKELQEKIKKEEEQKRLEKIEGEMVKSSFKQKIISETTSSKQDQDNGAAIIPKETVGTNTIVSTSTHHDHQTTSPPKTIFNEHTFNDIMKYGKRLCVTLERLPISQIPPNQLYKLSNNMNIIKQQEIKPTHDQIQKPPSKKRGCKRRIDVQNGKQEFNSRNNAEPPAKRNKMSLQRDCKNRSVYNC